VTGGVTGGETGGPPAGILGWADRPGARRLLAAARHKVEDGVGRRGSLGPLTPTERDDARVLLGVAWDASGREPTLGDLSDALARHGVELEELLVRLGGPVRDRPGERRARAAARAEETQAALEVVAAAVSDAARTGALPVGPHAVGLGDAVAQEILRRCLPPAGTGARLARARELAEMLRALPPAGAEPVLLAVLAARTFGDAHALDQSRPLGRAAARLVAVLDPAAADGDAVGWVDPVGSAELWRAAWAGVGVVCDTVSSQVLTLNLTLQGTSPAVALTAAAHGEPLWVTARALSRGTLAPSDGEVFVCENPAVVEEAATRLGEDSAPLVCTYGRPGLACLLLLRAYAAAGTRVHVRADGDAVGQEIVRTVLAEVPDAALWRFDETTTAYEEEVLDDLIRDLDRRATTAPRRPPTQKP